MSGKTRVEKGREPAAGVARRKEDASDGRNKMARSTTIRRSVFRSSGEMDEVGKVV